MDPLQPFIGLRISLASPEQIREWSAGEVTKPHLINYRTHQPEPGGLFCQRIFGPLKDWTCACGTYRRRRTPGFVCGHCGVALAPSRVRRERMGHITLAVPVVHSWFAHGTPNILALLLDLSTRQLAAILAYAAYLVTRIDEEKRRAALEQFNMEQETTRSLHHFLRMTQEGDVLNEAQYRSLMACADGCVQIETGAEAIRSRLEAIDLTTLAASLRHAIHMGQGNQQQAIKRLHIVEAFRCSGVNPAWMVLTVLPVLPPDLRPLVRLKSGRFAASDLNMLYARVLSRNARVRRFMSHGAPDAMLRHEKRLLQEACDALFGTGRSRRSSRASISRRRRPLKNLTNILSGKHGRFRRHLLGKRVDYSGRSVICVGLELQLHECGLPKKLALELFKPFVMRKLVDRAMTSNLRQAKRLVERRDSRVWDLLAECLHEKVVLLNRAPTLHRLSIQAFEAKLVEGDAIRLHPLVCSAFNADFDGDQMAVHLPLSEEAQAEARRLMLSVRNLRSPATGEPAISLSQEIVLGCFYLTGERPSEKQAGRVLTGIDEARLAYEQGIIDLHTPISVRVPDQSIYDSPPPTQPSSPVRGRIDTTVGRLIFNDVLPPCLRYRNYAMTKDHLKQIMAESLARSGEEATAMLADAIKGVGYHFATKSGISFAISDMQEPPEKQTLVAQGQASVQEIQREYQEGTINEQERDQRIIALWREITEQISQHVLEHLDAWGTVATIVKSGATKAKFQQIRQLSGIRGLMADPSGRILPIPVLGNYLVGLTAWEVFIAGPGARKGFTDRSLNTAPSGYLTRKLVETGMEVWTTMEDCGTQEGWLITDKESRALGFADLGGRVVGRVLAEKVADLEAGVLLNEAQVAHLLASSVTAIRVRSPFTCQADYGICCRCYGMDLATGTMVKRGVAVGIIAGQSIGEPGTQLTMRTFHSGGIAHAQGDITQGLPRVSELFEVRVPKGASLLAEVEGRVQIERDEATGQAPVIHVHLQPSEIGLEHKERVYDVSVGQSLVAEDGQDVEIGTPLTAGSRNPQQVLALQGREAAARYLINEVQHIYRGTGVHISEKHLEVIVRQMLRYVEVTDVGDTDVLPGAILDRWTLLRTNAHVLAQGGLPAMARPVLLGLTQTVLQTESWVAAASFQHTCRMLMHAAIWRQIDWLRGYKERSILGMRIPTCVG